MIKKCLIIIAIIAIILGVMIGLIYLTKYARQTAWEEFTRRYDYINNKT
jgi:ABC-type phosphate transport system permease subunit